MQREFKKGDRVFDAKYGWGTVELVQIGSQWPLKVGFASTQESYMLDGKHASHDLIPTLSHEEYTFSHIGKDLESKPDTRSELIQLAGQIANKLLTETYCKDPVSHLAKTSVEIAKQIIKEIDKQS